MEIQAAILDLERHGESLEAVALSIFGTLAEGGWSDPSVSWRECIAEVEAAWWALPEWERDDYRRAAKEAIAVAVGLNVVAPLNGA
jgi:hypothetical protein